MPVEILRLSIQCCTYVNGESCAVQVSMTVVQQKCIVKLASGYPLDIARKYTVILLLSNPFDCITMCAILYFDAPVSIL